MGDAIHTTDTSDLVKRTYHNTKINEIEKKITNHDYTNKDITTQEFNKPPAENFVSR